MFEKEKVDFDISTEKEKKHLNDYHFITASLLPKLLILGATIKIPVFLVKIRIEIEFQHIVFCMCMVFKSWDLTFVTNPWSSHFVVLYNNKFFFLSFVYELAYVFRTEISISIYLNINIIIL